MTLRLVKSNLGIARRTSVVCCTATSISYRNPRSARVKHRNATWKMPTKGDANVYGTPVTISDAGAEENDGFRRGP